MAATLLCLIITFFLLLPHLAAQQIGSFFTAIYLNGASAGPSQVSCSEMGQPGYCCESGQSCAWDDAGRVACCASGSTCSGSPYIGAAANQGQYQQQQQQQCHTCQPQCNTCQAQQQQTTVYQQHAPTTNYNAGPVVPIVPVTKATVLESYTSPPAPVTTYYSQYSQPTYTPPTTTTVIGAAGGVLVTTSVPANQACGPAGYTTLTEANVGAPVRTVGCYVIFNSGGGRRARRSGDGSWERWAWRMGMGLGLGLALGLQ